MLTKLPDMTGFVILSIISKQRHLHEKPIFPRFGTVKFRSRHFPSVASPAFSELQQNVTGKEHLQVAKRQLKQMDPDNEATQQMPALMKDAGGSGETLHQVTDAFFKGIPRNPNGNLIAKYDNSPLSNLSGYVQSCGLNFTTC